MQLDSVEALVDTLDNASTQIQSLNPTSFEGANLLLTGPGQFFDNQLTFADGVVDWKVDTGTLVGALTIASNPAYNDAWLQHSGTDIRDEIATSLRATASAAAEDPDAFAATVDWKGLEDHPIRWAGNQAPRSTYRSTHRRNRSRPAHEVGAEHHVVRQRDLANGCGDGIGKGLNQGHHWTIFLPHPDCRGLVRSWTAARTTGPHGRVVERCLSKSLFGEVVTHHLGGT